MFGINRKFKKIQNRLALLDSKVTENKGQINELNHLAFHDHIHKNYGLGNLSLDEAHYISKYREKQEAKIAKECLNVNEIEANITEIKNSSLGK